ncbi:MAG TPA: DUF5722 domain-containing protein [Candidatus Limnocylindria bacterium]|nr:DUF5722 domain-containing protein [Candidatus Limnocylindria bacterium]
MPLTRLEAPRRPLRLPAVFRVLCPLLLTLLLTFVRAGAVEPAPRYSWPFPQIASKKGLQIQMVDDAIALGVKHAGVNLNLTGLVDLAGDTNNPAWESGGRTFRFQRGYLAGLDDQVKRLTDAGAVVTAIVLTYASGKPELDAVMLHPNYSTNCPNHLGQFNSRTPEGRAWFTAAMEFLAERWSRPNQEHGRVANWVIGNEVNSHWFWANCGRVTMEQFADDYVDVLRLAHDAVHRESANSRVYVSLEHHWNIHYPGGDELQTFAARPFLEYFAKKARAGGDFAWNVAFHPYPENLFEPRTWNDKSATTNVDTTPRITFKNLELLPTFLRRPELTYHGQPRHIILSEQGFHTPDGPDGETIQAAAYCYAMRKIATLPEVDSMIMNRHVDHRDEGGLRLGVWRRNEASTSPCEPSTKKKIYEVFRLTDTPEWEQAYAFALPIIGIKSWDELKR